MSTQGKWYGDIADAAEERGYVIESVRPSELVLVRYSDHETRVSIESVLLSADLVRSVLAARPTKETQ